MELMYNYDFNLVTVLVSITVRGFQLLGHLQIELMLMLGEL